MYSLKEASAEYVTAFEETEKKLAACPAEVSVTCHFLVYCVCDVTGPPNCQIK